MNKKTVGIILSTAVISSSVTAFAAGGRKIEVFDNVKKIVVNKINKPFTKGEEPFTYNGRTYVPLRYVSEALGENVAWDGKTGTVYIGDTYSTTYAYLEKDIQHMSKSATLLKYKHNTDDTRKNNISEEFSSYLQLGNGYNKKAYVDFPLNGQYSKFTCNASVTYEHRDNQNEITLRILADDREVYKSTFNSSQMPKTISVDVKGVNKIRFETTQEKSNPVDLIFGNPKFAKK